MATSTTPSDHCLAMEAWPWALATAIVATLCTMLIQRCACGFALRPLRRTTTDHWTDRARLTHPGLVTLALGPIVLPFLWAAAASVAVDWQPHGVQPVVGLLVWLVAFTGVGFVSARVESRTRARTVTMLDWLRGWRAGLERRAALVQPPKLRIVGIPHSAAKGLAGRFGAETDYNRQIRGTSICLARDG